MVYKGYIGLYRVLWVYKGYIGLYRVIYGSMGLGFRKYIYGVSGPCLERGFGSRVQGAFRRVVSRWVPQHRAYLRLFW